MSSNNNDQPDPELMASQLRKPSGELAPKVGEKMNYVNEALFDLTLETMQLQSKEQVLEIGFGTGAFLNRMFDYTDNLSVSGIDFSEDMVEMAKANNKEAIRSGKLNITLGQSDDMPFPDSTFDKVFCNMVIYFWDKPEKHLSEVHRVLKPGGTFYTGIRSRESMLAFPFVEHGFNLYGAEQWKEILAENGFTVTGEKVAMDSELNVEGKTLRLESRCIVAQRVSLQ